MCRMNTSTGCWKKHTERSRINISQIQTMFYTILEFSEFCYHGNAGKLIVTFKADALPINKLFVALNNSW